MSDGAAQDGRASGSRWLRFAAWSAVGLLLVLALFHFGGVDLDELLATLGRLSPATFAFALGIHTAIYIVRAERFRLLIPAAHRPPRAALLAVTCLR